MIRAVFAERPVQLLFTCDGHAGGDKGSDIVCAAVSTAVELMKRMLQPNACIEQDGAVQMEIERPWYYQCGEWDIFREFFTDLAGKYPDSVSVSVDVM